MVESDDVCGDSKCCRKRRIFTRLYWRENCFQKIEEPFVSRGAPVFLQNIGRKTAFRKFSDLLFPEGNHPLLVADEDGPHLLKLLEGGILFTNGAGNQYVGVVGALGGSYLLISGP